MHLNSAGKAAMGFGTVSIDGAVPAALVGVPAGNYGGPCWLTSAKVAYQNNSSGSIVQSYDVGTAAFATLSAQGANFIAAGGGIWAAWLVDNTVGVRTNIPGVGPFLTGALGDVSPDGEFCLINTYPDVMGLTVYSAAGAVLLSLPEVVLKQNFIRMKSHLLLYRDASGWIMRNVINGPFAFRPRINETINWIVPVTTAAGKTFVVEVSDRITLRYADKADGYQLMPLGTITFNPDVIEYSAGVLRVGWSSTSGELPGDLTLMDITVGTGATVIGTVSGGAIAWAAGPTLALTTFQVGALQGSNAGGGLYPPIKHPMTDSRELATDPWVKFFQNVRTGLSDVTRSVSSLPPSVPAPPSFGTIAGGTGGPIVATLSGDTLTLTSGDASITITETPVTKTVDLRVSGLGPVGTGGVVMITVPEFESDELFVIPGSVGPQGPQGPGGPAGASDAMGPPGFDGEDAEMFLIPGPKGDKGDPGAAGASAPSQLVLLEAAFDAEVELLSIPGPPGASGISGTTALSALTAATGANTIASGDNHSQVWNWALTTNAATAFTFGETTAAAGAGANDNAIVQIKTLAGSTAIPLDIINAGNSFGLRVSDAAAGDTSNFLIDANGNLVVGGNADITGTAKAYIKTFVGADQRVVQLDDGTNTINLFTRGISATDTLDIAIGTAGYSAGSGNLYLNANGQLRINRAPPSSIAADNFFLKLGRNQGGSNGDLWMIGLGFAFDGVHSPAYIGYVQTSATSNTLGDLIFGTRSVTTNTAPSERVRIAATGETIFSGAIQAQAVAVSGLPASPVHGMIMAVTDSNTTTWGATVAGGGTNKVLAFYNGTAWTVMGA